MSRYTGRRGEPEKALLAATYLAHGFSIRRALRWAGYSKGVANRGKAALRHSQLLQRAVRLTMAGAFGARSTRSLQNRVRRALLAYVVSGEADLGICRMLSAWPTVDLADIRTEYYGRQRRVCKVVCEKIESVTQ